MTAPVAPQHRLRDALEPWCAAGATGALRALDPPGGAVYLTDGRVSYAECPPACGVDRLLTASGRLPADAWRSAASAGRAARRVGEVLLDQALLAPAELEAVVLSALYGAAHFLFDVHTEVRFDLGAAHPLGPVVAVDLAAACAEVDRRRRLLSDACADSRVDTHAVVPTRRLAGHLVALNALQWEIVANADRRRTPCDLARSLGRDTFATLLEARRLARAGLVEPGRPGAGAARGAAEQVRAAPDEDGPVSGGPVSGGSPPAADGGRRANGAGVASAGSHAPASPLPRRGPGDYAAAGHAAADPLEACPDSTLIRIRDALAALR